MSEDAHEQSPPVGGGEGEPGTPPPSSETAETQAQAGPTNAEVEEAQAAEPGTEGNDDTSQLLADGSHRSSEDGPPIGGGK